MAGSRWHVNTHCQPSTLLYLAADADVGMVTLMQPWETRAVFIDPLSDDWSHGGQGQAVVEGYKRSHAKDPRPYFRMTTQPLRPWSASPQQVNHLMKLLIGRLLSIPGMRKAREISQWRNGQWRDGGWHTAPYTRIVIAFKYRDNVRRTLDYRVSDAFADPQASTDNALADLKGTVGSISAFGNGWLLNAKPARSLISYLVPACASSMRLLAQIDERKLIAAAGLNVTHVDTINEYKAGDSLAGGRLVAFAAGV